jgi:hypothetical protein
MIFLFNVILLLLIIEIVNMTEGDRQLTEKKQPKKPLPKYPPLAVSFAAKLLQHISSPLHLLISILLFPYGLKCSIS